MLGYYIHNTGLNSDAEIDIKKELFYLHRQRVVSLERTLSAMTCALSQCGSMEESLLLNMLKFYTRTCSTSEMMTIIKKITAVTVLVISVHRVLFEWFFFVTVIFPPKTFPRRTYTSTLSTRIPQFSVASSKDVCIRDTPTLMMVSFKQQTCGTSATEH